MKNRNLLFLFSILTIWSNFKAQKISSSGEVHTNFTYLLKAKVNKKFPDKAKKELFYLQVTDSKAIFGSSILAKKDSVTNSVVSKTANGFTADFRNAKLPMTLYNYVIVQEQIGNSYFEPVAYTLFYYKEPVINDWELINETKTISELVCKKATVYYGGRKWIAWYTPEIPLQYGPYKFSGLPGLIVKITDENEEYDFQLVESKSSGKDMGKIYIRESRYTNAKQITKLELEKGIDNVLENGVNSQMSDGTIYNANPNRDRDRREDFRLFKQNYNTIELK